MRYKVLFFLFAGGCFLSARAQDTCRVVDLDSVLLNYNTYVDCMDKLDSLQEEIVDIMKVTTVLTQEIRAAMDTFTDQTELSEWLTRQKMEVDSLRSLMVVLEEAYLRWNTESQVVLDGIMTELRQQALPNCMVFGNPDKHLGEDITSWAVKYVRNKED